ncbi:hypothetical protein NBRC116593_28210 [Sulfitobacter pacificus]
MAGRYDEQVFSQSGQLSIDSMWTIVHIGRMTEHEIISLIETQATSAGLSEATICERAVGNSRLYSRLKSGGGCSTKTITRLVNYFGPKVATGATQ